MSTLSLAARRHRLTPGLHILDTIPAVLSV